MLGPRPGGRQSGADLSIARRSASVGNCRYGSVMPHARTIALGVLTVIAIVGCAVAPSPSPSAPVSIGPTASITRPAPTAASGQPEPSVVAVDPLGGPWRPAPLLLDDAHIAIVSDACAAAAREDLGETDANLPTALVDARGEGFVTAIMADDLNAIECLAHLDEAGTTATVDSVARLSMVAVAPVDKSTITVASVTHENDREGGRTVAFGRIGPDADAAKVGFGDKSVVIASIAEGWWATWWPGEVRATSYAAVDSHDLVVGNAAPPVGEVVARVGRASWWVNPRAAAPTATSTTIRALVLEQSCASGKPPIGRVEPPAIELTDTTVIVTYEIRRTGGDQDCQGNPPLAVELKLPEPLGKRTLLDGNETPPRDAMKVPAS